MAITAAKDRAEVVWQKFQTQTSEFFTGEEGFVSTLRERVESNDKVKEARANLNKVAEQVQGNKVWQKVSTASATVASLSEYRESLEKKADETVLRVKGALQIASTSDVEALQKQYKSLNRKVNEVNRKVKAIAAE
ncbi:MAG: hypothetical protein VX699_06440 [Myxococcota bacterium]|nr:hypothetical protein [Myxococcota bacterium]